MLCMFQAVPPPIVRNSIPHIQHWVLCQTVTATCHCRGSVGTGYQFQLFTTVAGNSKGLTMLYILFWAPDDGRRNRLKHLEHFSEINKLYNIAYCCLYLIVHKTNEPWKFRNYTISHFGRLVSTTKRIEFLMYEGNSISKLQIVIEKNRMEIMTYKQHLFFNIISIQI